MYLFCTLSEVGHGLNQFGGDAFNPEDNGCIHVSCAAAPSPAGSRAYGTSIFTDVLPLSCSVRGVGACFNFCIFCRSEGEFLLADGGYLCRGRLFELVVYSGV